MRRLLLVVAMVVPVILAVAAPAPAQVSGGNNNTIVCANLAAQDAQAAVIGAQEDVQAILANLLNQLNRCGVFVTDNHTTINNNVTQNSDNHPTINSSDNHPTINNDTINRNITQESPQNAKSGNIDTTADVSNSGPNAALCTPIMQSDNNTGNDQTGQQVAQSDTATHAIEQSGNASQSNPQLTVKCAQEINGD